MSDRGVVETANLNTEEWIGRDIMNKIFTSLVLMALALGGIGG